MAKEIDRLRVREHIVEGLVRLLDDGAAFLVEVAACADKRKAKDVVMKTWGLSEIQAAYALDMQFSRATKLGRQDLQAELTEIRKAIDELDI